MELSRARAELDRIRVHLEDRERLTALGRLTATIAHEVRNPLTAMKMWLHMIRVARPDAAGLDHKCTMLSQEICRLERLVGEVLEVARPASLERAPLQMPRLLDRTLDLMAPRMREKELRVCRRDAVTLPAVHGDSAQLVQVFLNLLDNAREATPRGGEISIQESLEQASEHGEVVVRVRDTGPGMPERVRGRLFEPFVTTKADGTGLGLYIAAGITARHGGRLELERSTDGGCVFAVSLPAMAGA